MKSAPDRSRLCSLAMLPPEKADASSLDSLRALPRPTRRAQDQALSFSVQADGHPLRTDLPRTFSNREALLSASERRVGDFFRIPVKGGEKT